ncbi:hypothetical protein ACFX1R_027558 [Malus domestica]
MAPGSYTDPINSIFRSGRRPSKHATSNLSNNITNSCSKQSCATINGQFNVTIASIYKRKHYKYAGAAWSMVTKLCNYCRADVYGILRLQKQVE